MRVLNKLTQKELGWKGPFEVYYRKMSTVVAKASHKNHKTISQRPTSNELKSIKNLHTDIKG